MGKWSKVETPWQSAVALFIQWGWGPELLHSITHRNIIAVEWLLSSLKLHGTVSVRMLQSAHPAGWVNWNNCCHNKVSIRLLQSHSHSSIWRWEICLAERYGSFPFSPKTHLQNYINISVGCGAVETFWTFKKMTLCLPAYEWLQYSCLNNMESN